MKQGKVASQFFLNPAFVAIIPGHVNTTLRMRPFSLALFPRAGPSGNGFSAGFSGPEKDPETMEASKIIKGQKVFTLKPAKKHRRSGNPVKGRDQPGRLIHGEDAWPAAAWPDAPVQGIGDKGTGTGPSRDPFPRESLGRFRPRIFGRAGRSGFLPLPSFARFVLSV
ncbi:hypothetical protein GIY56_16330 [Paracoccus sp. YIM 132242]|uniref:Uncharacterized protein n=1 Tax=Paracoccus lichenicola TaxID=2665644 RepID=A0A6L6HWZ8_9RHOB|nr:hypothetical protein [Paracoccus lichenicola]MTE01858.1 hypothetical protein [Paracoccus lichenicola]